MLFEYGIYVLSIIAVSGIIYRCVRKEEKPIIKINNRCYLKYTPLEKVYMDVV